VSPTAYYIDDIDQLARAARRSNAFVAGEPTLGQRRDVNISSDE
jgi:hypothetical protein